MNDDKLEQQNIDQEVLGSSNVFLPDLSTLLY